MTENRTHILFAIAFLLLSLLACTGVSAATDVAMPVPTAITPTSAHSVQPTVAWTTVPSETTLEIPTETQPPNVADLPTATPMLELPVGLGTPVPQPAEAIMRSNTHRIIELARYGSPAIWDLQLTDDGTKLFASTSGGAMVFNAATDELLAKFGTLTRKYTALSPSYDGSRVLIETDDDIRIYTSDGSLIRVVMEIPAETKNNWMRPAAALSPDGQVAAIGYGIPDYETYNHRERFDILRVDTGEVIFSERGLKPVFSPVGSLMAVEWDGKVMIYDTATWEQVTHLSLWMMDDSEWRFSPDGTRMAISSPERVEIWDIASRKVIRSIDGYEKGDWAPKVRWSPEGMLVGVQEADNAVSSWLISDGQRISKLALDANSDFRIANNGEPRQYSLELGGGIPAFGTYQTKLQFNNDSLVAIYYHSVSSQSTAIVICNLSLVGLTPDCQSRPGASTAYALGNDGELYSIAKSSDQAVFKNGEDIIATIAIKNGLYLGKLFYIGDNTLLVTQGNRYETLLQRWNISNERTKSYSFGGYLAGQDISSSGDYAALLTKSDGYKLSITDRDMRVLYQDVGYYNAAWSSLAFRLDESILAYAKDTDTTGSNHLYYLDIDTRKIVADFDLGSSSPVSALKFSLDGSLVAVGLRNGEIMLLNAADGTVIRTWQAHQDQVTNLDFSADGTMLATMSHDGFIKVWGIWL